MVAPSTDGSRPDGWQNSGNQGNAKERFSVVTAAVTVTSYF